MPEGKSGNNAEQKAINTLRRSPRFLHQNQIASENPETPKPAARKLSASASIFTPLGQKNGDGILQNGGKKGTQSRTSVKSRIDKRVTRNSVGGSRFQDNECDGVSGKGDESSEKLGKRCRRSARLGRRADTSKREEVVSQEKQCVIEKRVTRSSVRGEKVVICEVSDSDSAEDYGERVRFLPKEGKAKENMANIEKRVTRSCSRTKMALSTNSREEVVKTDEMKTEGDDELSELYRNRKDVKDCGVSMRNGDTNSKRKTGAGEKRDRYHVEEEFEAVQGWTKEQELALQKAYFTAKPTPQFWKKVARMVPGKSAEECFDRIHSDHLTPSQPQRRSRAKMKEQSPLSFSASKLLSPAEKKNKKVISRRRTLQAQKTVRQLLQKQQNENQDYEADLFSVLEPMTNPSLNFREGTPFASRAPNQGSHILTTCRQMSSSAQRKHRSRLNSSQKAAFVSPPVLKQIKNKALHEKYIDQLHCRDAKRKAESLRNAKNTKDLFDEMVNHLKPNSVKVAKDALVSDAQDAINQLRSLQSSTNHTIDDDDSTYFSDENEDEDEIC